MTDLRTSVFALTLLASFVVAACDEPEPVMRTIPVAPSAGDDDDDDDHEEGAESGLVDEALASRVRDPSELVRGRRTVMGTSFEISVAGMEEAEATPLIERALDEVARLDGRLSEWRDESEISAINRAAGSPRAVEVSEETFLLVSAGIDVSRRSGGAFDLTWAALRGLYLFQPDDHRVPTTAEIRARLPLIDWEQIQLDREARTIRLARRNMILGTGAIAKGYALDRAAEVLLAGGAENFMMYGGGQVQVHGMRDGRPWRVGIQHPRDAATYIAFLELTSGSMSTSGDYEHAFVDDEGTHWHHIIDVETGLPARRCMQVTLIAEDGIHADALSTAVFVMGPERGLQMLADMPGSPQAVIIDDALRVHTTPGIRERLVWRVERPNDRLPGDPTFHAWNR